MKAHFFNNILWGIPYQLTRLSDVEYRKLRQNSLAIAEDYSLLYSFYKGWEHSCRELGLAPVYVTLKELCGESGQLFDEWKGSFSFPFLFEQTKEQRSLSYLVNIYNYRSTIEFSIRKIIDPDDDRYDRAVIHQPFEDEFSREEINNLIKWLNLYIRAFFKRKIKDTYDVPFFKKVDSNLIVFGYKDGEFFEDHYDSPEEYKAALEMLESYQS